MHKSLISSMGHRSLNGNNAVFLVGKWLVRDAVSGSGVGWYPPSDGIIFISIEKVHGLLGRSGISVNKEKVILDSLSRKCSAIEFQPVLF